MRRYASSLADLVAAGPVSEHVLRRIGHSLCCTLDELHAAGIVVRDIKPANVLMDAHNRPVFSDFGIATSPRVAQTGITGTFNYMAPEAFDPPLGAPSDVWSMACVLVEMHTGVQPWAEMQLGQIVTAVHALRRVPDFPATMPELALVRRCFSFAPDKRPTAGALARALSPDATAAAVASALSESEATLGAVLEAHGAKLALMRDSVDLAREETHEARWALDVAREEHQSALVAMRADNDETEAQLARAQSALVAMRYLPETDMSQACARADVQCLTDMLMTRAEHSHDDGAIDAVTTSLVAAIESVLTKTRSFPPPCGYRNTAPPRPWRPQGIVINGHCR
jgi:hypothetical protein